MRALLIETNGSSGVGDGVVVDDADVMTVMMVVMM